MADAARHPLIERLVGELGIPEVGAGDVDGFLAAPGDVVLFFTEDPKQYPESADVAVILPELVQSLPGRFRAAVVDRASERALQKRFGRWGLAYLESLVRAADYAASASPSQTLEAE